MTESRRVELLRGGPRIKPRRYLLAALRHADAVRVDAGGTHGVRIGGKIGWCRRADSNRQPIAYEAIALPLSYCGLQNGPCIKLLSNKPPPVEEAQSYPSSLPGLTRQSIPFELSASFRWMPGSSPGMTKRNDRSFSPVTRGLDHASRIYPTCAPKTTKSGKPDFGWSIIVRKKLLRRGWIAGSSTRLRASIAREDGRQRP